MTPTDEQVERVARAIYETASGPWGHASYYAQEIVRREARAAIAALQPQDGLAELRALSEKATPGPWEAAPQEGPQGHCHMAQVFGPDPEGKSVANIDSTPDPAEATATAAFIVACVNHVRAELERKKD